MPEAARNCQIGVAAGQAVDRAAAVQEAAQRVERVELNINNYLSEELALSPAEKELVKRALTSVLADDTQVTHVTKSIKKLSRST